MERKPDHEFGMRKPAPVPAAAPVKRSRHVALLLTGALAIGGGAYALMPSENCQPGQPGMAAPTGCSPRGTSSGGGSGGRSGFYGGDPSSTRPSSGSSSESGSVTRGGFGSFARSFTAHFSGGG